MASASEQKLKIKRAILSELNKELAKKTQSLAPKSKPARLHKQNNKPYNASSKFNAQPYSSNHASFPKKDSQIRAPLTLHPKTVRTSKPHTKHVIEEPRLSRYECVRKYIDLWKCKAFGNVTNFSDGVRHFRKVLLLKTLLKWKEVTYRKQTEWKLLVRADCHYRFCVKEKYWDLWRVYLKHNKTTAQNKQKADDFCSRLLLRRYVYKLKNAVVWRKDYNANKSVAEAMYTRTLCKKVIAQWQQSITELQIYREKETIALHFWSLSLQRQCPLTWHQYKNTQLMKKDINAVITTFYCKKLLQRSVRCWISYYRQRKVKNILARRADKLLVSKLQHRYFYCWNEQMYVSVKTRQLEQQMAVTRKKFVCRKIVQHWKCYSEQVKHAQDLECLADDHARKKVLSKFFTSLKSYKMHQKHTETLKIAAEKLRYKNMLRQSFLRWVQKTDDAEEDKMRYRTLMARKHYQMKVLRQCVMKWYDYREYRMERQEMYDMADDHYNTTITQLMFTNWHLYICYRKNVTIKKESAMLHRNDLLYHKYFFTWVKMFHHSRNLRQDERIAMLHYENKVSSSYFYKWKALSKVSMTEGEKMKNANDHYHSSLLLKAFNAFKQNRERVHNIISQIKLAVEHYSKKQLREKLEIWKEFTTLCRKENQQQSIAINHHNNKTLTLWFKSWRQHHAIISRAKQTICSIGKENEQKFLHKCIKQWFAEVKFRKISTDKNVKAEYHYRTTLCLKVLTGWLLYVEKRAKDDINKFILLEEAEVHLNRLRQRQILNTWKTKSEVALNYRFKIEVADEHYKNKLMKQILYGLKSAVKISFKKRLLCIQLTNYRTDITLQRFFSVWKSRWNLKIKENKQTEDALWYWCVSLEHRVLRAWLAYTHYRRTKSKLYSEALQDRRKYLLETGLRQWVDHVTTSDEIRNKAALLAVTQQTYRANQLALKWGKHWYNTVKRRVAKHPCIMERKILRTRQDKENICTSVPNLEHPTFYTNFNSLKSNRPAPKIPSFFIQKKYCS